MILNDGAPQRYNVRRLVEFSDFKDWQDVSKRFAPMYAQASTLAKASPLLAEIERIKAASSSPTERAQAALRLVQEQIRYVYVGLDGGNFLPASADATWQRRFGDCKAKTALLLALLHAMDIEAEPVLADVSGNDGTDARLPSPGVFNHVLIRAKIDGAAHWLDGTGRGDLYLDMIEPPPFQWALPVRADGAALEAVPTKLSDRPQFVAVVDIDARAGFAASAKVRAKHVMRDSEAFAIRSRLLSLSAEDADRSLRSYWRNQISWLEPGKVDWRYDDRQKRLVLSIEGEGKPDWDLNEDQSRDLDVPNAGFYPPDRRVRPKEQDQAAPWATRYPRFRCFATTIRLPDERPRWGWAYRAKPMNVRLGGTIYWRVSGMNDDVLRVVMSSRTEKPEISAEQADMANRAIAGFDNKVSRVYQTSMAGRERFAAKSEPLPFDDADDWLGDAPKCRAPAGEEAS